MNDLLLAFFQQYFVSVLSRFLHQVLFIALDFTERLIHCTSQTDKTKTLVFKRSVEVKRKIKINFFTMNPHFESHSATGAINVLFQPIWGDSIWNPTVLATKEWFYWRKNMSKKSPRAWNRSKTSFAGISPRQWREWRKWSPTCLRSWPFRTYRIYNSQITKVKSDYCVKRSRLYDSHPVVIQVKKPAYPILTTEVIQKNANVILRMF